MPGTLPDSRRARPASGPQHCWGGRGDRRGDSRPEGGGCYLVLVFGVEVTSHLGHALQRSYQVLLAECGGSRDQGVFLHT